MNCPKCGGKWRVVDSRHSWSDPNANPVLTDTGRVLGEGAENWHARQRVCEYCGHEDYTVEVPAGFLRGLRRRAGV